MLCSELALGSEGVLAWRRLQLRCKQPLRCACVPCRKHGCVFQVLPELLGAGHAARADAAAYWRLRSAWPCRPEAAALLHCDALRQLLAAALGSSSVLLFNEQYIIKLPAGGTHTAGSAFAWHYDSHWCRGARYSPYLSLWVALDDMTHDNGGLVVLPWSSVGASGGGREQGAAVRAPPHCASGQAQFAQFDSSEQLQRLLARQQLQEGCDSDSVEPLGLQMRAGSAVNGVCIERITATCCYVWCPC